MPSKNLKVKTFSDLVKFIKDNKIEDFQVSISSPEGFKEYEIESIDMSYGSKRATIYVEKVSDMTSGFTRKE